jgi:phage terminase large subunit GpA-like protein
MEAMVDPAVKEVCILAAIQATKSLGAELTLAYIIENLPGPTLWLCDNDENAKDHSESRLQPLFEKCDPIKRLFPADKNKKRNTTIHFNNGMSLWILGAHNLKNLQRRSIRWIIGDECWNWPQGHMEEAEGRTTSFGWLGKCIWMSQAGVEDDDLDRKWKSTDQREWTFRCPECGSRQPYKWQRVEWDKTCKDEEGNYNFETLRESTRYKCIDCEHLIEDTYTNRRKMADSGAFEITNQNASKELVGFHWNGIATMKWGRLAEMYIRAKLAAKKGDMNPLIQFYQKRLAQPWDESAEDFGMDVPTQAYELGNVWGKEGALNANMQVVESTDKTARVPLRFLTVDVQTDHFWLKVRSWSPLGQSRLIWYEKVLTWEDVEAVQHRFEIHPQLVFCDSGYNPYEVYKQCGPRGWTALKGDQKDNFIHVRKLKDGTTEKTRRFYSPVHKVAAGRDMCRLHHYSANNMRDILQKLRNLKIGDEPMWQIPDETGKDYRRQLEAERRIKKGNKWVWQQIGKRPNHYFDCEVMDITAAVMLKIIGGEAVDTAANSNEGRN